MFSFLPPNAHCAAYAAERRHFDSVFEIEIRLLWGSKIKEVNQIPIRRQKHTANGINKAKQYFPNFRARTRPKKSQKTKAKKTVSNRRMLSLGQQQEIALVGPTGGQEHRQAVLQAAGVPIDKVNAR